MGTRQSWLRAAGAQRLKPPQNDNRVTVCLPLGPSRCGWNLGPIYEEILEHEPTLAAIERTATATAHKLATGRRGRRRGAPRLHHRHLCLPRHSRRLAGVARQGPSDWKRCRRPGSAQRRCIGLRVKRILLVHALVPLPWVTSVWGLGAFAIAPVVRTWEPVGINCLRALSRRVRC